MRSDSILYMQKLCFKAKKAFQGLSSRIRSGYMRKLCVRGSSDVGSDCSLYMQKSISGAVCEVG